MNSFRAALLLIVSIFALSPAVSFAQAPDDVQSSSPALIIGRSQSKQAQLAADERTLEIESTRSDLADLSKFEHDHEYLPKSIYKRYYAERPTGEQMVAGKPQADDVIVHRM
jgi:hypothetical protein